LNDIFDFGANAMTMHVNLPLEMETYIRSKVESGIYRNSTEAIRDAIRRMQAHENRETEGEGFITQGDGKGEGRESFIHILADAA